MLRLFLAMLPVVAFAAPMAPTAATPPLMLGASWYPEQWPEARWDADLALMQAAGLRMVRVGEFAWSSLEPEEGRFTLDWLDRAIAAAAAHHIVVVLGTPTDAPPAWLTSKYPETLRVDENGRRLQHGERRQFSYTSAKYRELCRRIVEQLARRFGHNPDVIGWQIGNEYTEDSFDPESRRLFHEWLQAKYQTLDALNRHWTTAYWSQAYDSWDEIPMGSGRGNPGLLLDYKRFVTDEWRSFQRNQLDVIRREADPRQFITTNLGGLGWADRFNRREIAADLDLVSWDTYVGQGHVDPYRLGATHDLVRGWKGRNFWVMEMQPASVDWAGISNSLDQGETRAMVWEAVGHGADCVAFWQWRSALSGQEQYHGALVGTRRPAAALLCRGAANRGRVRAGRPGVRRHRARIAGRDPARLRQPVGHRLPSADAAVRPDRRAPRLLPRAPRRHAIRRHRRPHLPARRLQAGRGAEPERHSAGPRAAPGRLRGARRPPGARPALRHEG